MSYSKTVVICAVTGIAAGLFAPAVIGQVIINATFDNEPLGPLPKEPQTDPLPLSRPSSFRNDSAACSENVANPIGDFDSQVMLMQGAPNPESFNDIARAYFSNPAPIGSGIYKMSWDSLVTSNTSAAMAINTLAGGRNSFMLVVDYLSSGQLDVFTGATSKKVGAYSPNTAQHFEIDIDMDQHDYELRVDGSLLYGGAMANAGYSFYNTAFYSSPLLSTGDPGLFALDNFKLELIPEPALSLLLCAAGAIIIRNRPRK